MAQTATVAVDPHVHSEGSYDGREPVELLLEHVAEIDLDGIVVTDHDAIEESLRAAELAPEYGLLGIAGVEVSTAHGHLLAIGVETRPERGRPLAETVEWVRDLGGVAVVLHPFQRSRHGIKKRHLTDCDAIEGYNSMLLTGYRNRRRGPSPLRTSIRRSARATRISCRTSVGRTPRSGSISNPRRSHPRQSTGGRSSRRCAPARPISGASERRSTAAHANTQGVRFARGPIS